MTAFSSEVRQAIEECVEAGKKLMRETKRGKDVNGWEITLDMGRYGTRRGSGSVQCRRRCTCRSICRRRKAGTPNLVRQHNVSVGAVLAELSYEVIPSGALRIVVRLRRGRC